MRNYQPKDIISTIEKKLKNDKNFIPYLLAVEKSCKRKGRKKRSEIICRPTEDVRIRRRCVEEEDSNI